MMKKGIGFVGVVLGLILSVAFFMLRDETPDIAGESQEQSGVVDGPGHPAASEPVSRGDSASEAEEAPSDDGRLDYLDWLDSLSPTEFEQLEDWLESHGHFGALHGERGMQPENFGDYGSYSEETLRQLADNANDAKAQLILGWQLSEQQGDFEAARPYLEQAVVNGYTSPLRYIRKNLRERARDGSLSESERREHYEKSLAWANVATRRQSPMAEFEQKVLGIAMEHGLSDHFPEADPETVERLSEEFYRNLESRRRQRGLGPFDHSRPEIGDEFERHLQSELDSVREQLADATNREAEPADR